MSILSVSGIVRYVVLCVHMLISFPVLCFLTSPLNNFLPLVSVALSVAPEGAYVGLGDRQLLNEDQPVIWNAYGFCD